MLFATYIQLLHKCIEPDTGRGDFTEKILKMIVKNEKKLNYSSISSYNGFYDGKTLGKGKDKKIIGDKVQTCAKKIVGYLDVSEDKVNTLPRFKNYLKELRFNTSAKKQLCDSFRCELPNINVDNYIDELSELLIKIIKVAAGKESKEENTIPSIEANSSDSKEDLVSNNTDFLSDNHVEEKNIEHIDDELSEIPKFNLLLIDNCITDVRTLIDILLQKGESLAKEVNRNPISTPYRKCSNWAPFQKKFDEYQEKNIKLHTYFENYDCNIFTPAIEFKNQFTADSFWRCNPMRYTSKLDTKNKIIKYKEILLKILKKIEKRLN